MKFAELTQEVQIARPQAAKQETGLAPGRRLANQQFKEAMAKAREDGGEIFQFLKLDEIKFFGFLISLAF